MHVFGILRNASEDSRCVSMELVVQLFVSSLQILRRRQSELRTLRRSAPALEEPCGTRFASRLFVGMGLWAPLRAVARGPCAAKGRGRPRAASRRSRLLREMPPIPDPAPEEPAPPRSDIEAARRQLEPPTARSGAVRGARRPRDPCGRRPYGRAFPPSHTHTHTSGDPPVALRSMSLTPYYTGALDRDAQTQRDFRELAHGRS